MGLQLTFEAHYYDEEQKKEIKQYVKDMVVGSEEALVILNVPLFGQGDQIMGGLRLGMDISL